MAPRHAPNLAPRLLNKQQAAAYCGICSSVFDAVSSVPPIELKSGLKRWDRHALDRWIDSLDRMTDGIDSLTGLYEPTAPAPSPAGKGSRKCKGGRAQTR